MKPFIIQNHTRPPFTVSFVRILSVLSVVILSIAFHGFALADDRSLPFFPKKDITKKDKPFGDILKDYRRKNYAIALKKTVRLKKDQQKGPIEETALFLLGDLHLKLAEEGDSRHLRKALTAFQSARASYPNSENAARGLWRIGQTYALLDLYYESIANYNRLLIKQPESLFTSWAQLGIAETYTRWGKIEKAIESYNKINLHKISTEGRSEVLMKQADLLYQLDRFEASYRTYEKIPKGVDTLKMMPEAFFQHADSAHRTKHYKRSRKLFMNFFDLYPNTFLAPIALSKIGESWYLEGKNTLSRSFSKRIRSLKSASSDRNIYDLLAAINDLRFSPEGKKNRAGGLALKEIEKRAAALLAGPPLPLPLQRVILEAAEESARHGALVIALNIEGTLLNRLPSSLLKKKVRSVFQKTADKTIEKLLKENETTRVVELYHRYQADFQSKKSNGSLLLKVAIAHAQTGLFPEVVKLLTPIAENENNALGEEALFQLTEVHFQTGEYNNAEENARRFLKQYPKSIRLPDILELSAKLKDRQGKMDQAIQEYRSWLKRYPKHRNKDQVSFLLADAHQRKGDLRPVLEVYTKMNSSFKKLNKSKEQRSELHLKLADTYFMLGRYKKSAEFYHLVLKGTTKGEKAEWAQFQLAMSYERIGKKNKGAQIFTQLAERAKDPLLKGLSAQKTNTR